MSVAERGAPGGVLPSTKGIGTVESFEYLLNTMVSPFFSGRIRLCYTLLLYISVGTAYCYAEETICSG